MKASEKLGKAIASLRKVKGLTQAELAGLTGLAVSSISAYEQGRIVPRANSLRKIMKVLRADEKFLMPLLEEALREKIYGENQPESFGVFRREGAKLINVGEISDVVSLPVLGRVHAGDPTISDAEVIDVLKLPRYIARKADYALEVKGMSMKEEGILPGDIVLVKMQGDADNNQIVIARIGEEEYTIKRLRKDDNGEVWLEPANSDYKPIKGKSFTIVGRVVYAMKKFF
jgi:SOS regulatory protein LexA